MATLVQIINELDDFIESAEGLALACIKGFPDFKNPNLSIPVSAIYYTGSSEAGESPRRVGDSRKFIVINLAVYAANEVDLIGHAQNLQALRRSRVELATGDGTELKVIFGEDERLEPAADDPKELRHVIECQLVISY